MKGTYTKISATAFQELEVDAGLLLYTFDPETPNVTDANIITATTGGITISCVPTYSDWGEDVDNCPNNTKELKHLDGWDCKVSTTALSTNVDFIAESLGAADKTANKVTPRANLKLTDFHDRWWVGDRADGGFVAVKIINALSTGGFSLKTTKDGKGNLDMELTGHVSMAAQDVVPMEFYVYDGEDAEAEYIYTAVTPTGTENPAEEGWYVLVGDTYRVTSDAEVDSNVTYYERTTA